MGNLKELKDTLPFIEIEADKMFLVKIKHKGIIMAETIVSISQLEYNVSDIEKSRVVLTTHEPL